MALNDPHLVITERSVYIYDEEKLMARPQSIDEEELLSRLGRVFRDVGYEGASVAVLSEATGLQKASLYHRYPGGKQEMAEHVLSAAMDWFGERLIAHLNGEGPPERRLAEVTKSLSTFYDGGRQACLLNVLASPRVEPSSNGNGPFSPAIKVAIEQLVDGFAKLARDAGLGARLARERGGRALMLVQGGLVLSRGLGSVEPFRLALKALPGELLKE